MPVPWLQIIQWVPSIMDLSRELLRQSKRTDPQQMPTSADVPARLAALEENERKQAELVARMAEQSATLTEAVTALHKQLQASRLMTAAAVVFAAAACVIALVK